MSHDAGATWQVRPAPWNEGCAATDFVDAQDGWAIVEDVIPSHIFRTTDGGVTWVDSGPTPLRRPQYVVRLGPEIAFVSGEWGSGAIARTTDGGKTWERRQIAYNTFAPCKEGLHAVTVGQRRIVSFRAPFDLDCFDPSPYFGAPIPNRDGVLNYGGSRRTVLLPSVVRFLDGKPAGGSWLRPTYELRTPMLGTLLVDEGLRVGWTSHEIVAALPGGTWAAMAKTRKHIVRLGLLAKQSLPVAVLDDGSIEVATGELSFWERSEAPALRRLDLLRSIGMPADDPMACLQSTSHGSVEFTVEGHRAELGRGPAISLPETLSIEWTDVNSTISVTRQHSQPNTPISIERTKQPFPVKDRRQLVEEIVRALEEADGSDAAGVDHFLIIDVHAHWRCDNAHDVSQEFSMPMFQDRSGRTRSIANIVWDRVDALLGRRTGALADHPAW